MIRVFEKIKNELRMFDYAFTGRDLTNRKDPRYAKSKLIFACISMIAAILLWGIVAWNGNGEITRTVTVPISYSHPAQGMAAFRNTESVTVKIAGNMAQLSKLDKTELAAEVDISGIAPGKYSLPVNVSSPSGTRVVACVPQFVEIELYKKSEKNFRVRIKPVGPEAEETEPVTAEILPASASVSGPRDELAKVGGVEARVPTDVLEAEKPYTSELTAVDIDGKPVQRVVINPKTVVVKPEIQREGTAVPLKAVLHGQPAAGYEISSIKLTPERVNLAGEQTAIEGLHFIELPAIDITGIKEDFHTVLPLVVPLSLSGVSLIGADSVRIDITLKKGLASKVYAGVPVKISGAKPGDRWICLPAKVSVSVEASRSLLDVATEYPCEAIADVTSIVSDSIKLPLIAENVKKGIRIVRIEPEEVILKREK
ncbi:MAG: CdaR family protein [Synergistaceae bacterium]|nr:CdaR family protein [Synergistaceae bacterium]